MDLSIIIVNWNSKAYLKLCLASLREHARDVRYEVIVVDNASFDGASEMVASEFPNVVFLQSAENLGFARANNLAFARSCGQRVLFLNPDTEIRVSAISALMQALDTLPNAGIVGARLLNTDGSLQTTCITALPSIANQALASNFLRRRFPRLRLWGMGPLYKRGGIAAEVDAISGACMMAKRELIETINCFTTEFFMYSEDMDLCIKARKAGARIYYAPNAVIVHHGGRSSGAHENSNFSSVMQCESLVKFFQRHRGISYARMYRVSTTVMSASRMALIVLLFPVTVALQGYRRWLRMAGKWSAILMWSLGFSDR
jgi:N-acetylglucosaminyl-diphospho-decaprenol L-rhamnosyltransferase